MKKLFGYIDANVCKNDRCGNLAISQAPDYISPSYFLGFNALHCSKCGSNSLLLNNADINLIVEPNFKLYLTEVKGHCPHCYALGKIHYGHTQQKTPRVKCKICHTVYSNKKLTDKQKNKLHLLVNLLLKGIDFKKIITELNISYSQFYRLLTQLEFICKKNKLLIEQHHLTKEQIHIATASTILIARGHIKPLQLWGITSSLSNSGYILLNNLNSTKQNVSTTSLYDSQKPIAPSKITTLDVDAVIAQYELFYNRKSFDQLTYHSHPFANNRKEKIIEPAICAYAHFYELKQYYIAKQTYHYLEHEIALRGAAITSFGDTVRNHKCTLFYLHESSQQHSTNKISIINKQKIGWWENDWYIMQDATQHIQRLLGLLTPSKQRQLSEEKIAMLPATFAGITNFHQMFYHYFPPKRLAKLSASNIQSLLTIFTHFYNFCLSNPNGKTTAQIAGLSTKRLTFEELIK